MGLFDFAFDELLSEDEAREVTAPFWSDLAGVWNDAWDCQGSMSEEHRARLAETPYVSPMVLHGFVQSYARERLLGREDDGIVLCDQLQGPVGFYIEDKVLVRFNAVSRKRIVPMDKNTNDHKRLYFKQSPLRGLNNAATRLTVGCIANAAKTGPASIIISCQFGEELVYSFPIDGSGGAVLPIPGPVVEPSPDRPFDPLTGKHQLHG